MYTNQITTVPSVILPLHGMSTYIVDADTLIRTRSGHKEHTQLCASTIPCTWPDMFAIVYCSWCDPSLSRMQSFASLASLPAPFWPAACGHLFILIMQPNGLGYVRLVTEYSQRTVEDSRLPLVMRRDLIRK